MNEIENKYIFIENDEILNIVNRIKENYSSIQQSISVFNNLLKYAPDYEFVLAQIPNVLICSSDDFKLLYPSFVDLVKRNPLSAPKLLSILSNFDFDSKVKKEAFELALMIFDVIDKDYLSDMISFMMLTISDDNIMCGYEKMRDLFLVYNDIDLFKTFENCSLKYISQFFQMVVNVDKWCFFDFYIIVLAVQRPSLRNKIPGLLWNSILSKKLDFDSLHNFLLNTGILLPKYHSISIIFDVFVSKVPSFLINSVIEEISSIATCIIVNYTEYSLNFIDQLLNYVFNGNYLMCTFAIHALVQIDPITFQPLISSLNDFISQSNKILPSIIHFLSDIISISSPQSRQPTLMITLSKRLNHHSQFLIETAIILAQHLTMNGIENGNEILEWVIKSANFNYKLMTPSALLSVIDIIWIRSDNTLIEQIVVLFFNILKSYDVIRTYENKLVISMINVPNNQYSEVYGEIIYFLNVIFNSDINNLNCYKNLINESLANNDDMYIIDINNNKVSSMRKKESLFLFIKNINNLHFLVPKIYFDFQDSDDNKLMFRQMEFLQTFLLSLISKFNYIDKTIRQFFSIIQSIDRLFSNEDDLDNFRPNSSLILSPLFIFNNIKNYNFDIVEDLFILELFFSSLCKIFLTRYDHRFFFVDSIDYLQKEVDNELIDKILEICSFLLFECNSNVDARNKKRYIKIIGNALDFITFCARLLKFDVDYNTFLNEKIKKIEDVGNACQFIFLGFQLGINQDTISKIANQDFICDVLESSLIFPLMFPDIKIIKPNLTGIHWRLIIYLSLQTDDFIRFYNQFKIYLKQIKNKNLEKQRGFVLLEILPNIINKYNSQLKKISKLVFKLIKIYFE